MCTKFFWRVTTLNTFTLESRGHQSAREQTQLQKKEKEMIHWTFLSAMSPFCDWTSSLRLLWLKRRMRAPGSRAMQAIASSCSSRSQENKSSSDDTSDSMTPVWTQMKLYGRRPTKADQEQNCSYMKLCWEKCSLNWCIPVFCGVFFFYLHNLWKRTKPWILEGV